MKEDYSISEDPAAYQNQDGRTIIADGGDPDADDFDSDQFYEVPGADEVDGKVVVSDQNVVELAQSMEDALHGFDSRGGFGASFYSDDKFRDAVNDATPNASRDYDQDASLVAEIGLALGGIKRAELGAETPGSPDYEIMIEDAVEHQVAGYSDEERKEELIKLGAKAANGFDQVLESEHSEFKEEDFALKIGDSKSIWERWNL